MNTNTHSTFNNLFLLNNICDHLNHKELLCMMRTSRLGFDTAASRIWRDLNGIEPLLTLLGPTLELLAEDDDEEIMKVDLSYIRFPNVYMLIGCFAPWLQLESWSTLSREVQRAPLLPNLESLRLSEDLGNENKIILWISLLVSPSLKTLDLRGFRTILSHLGTATVLGLLTQNTPNLEKFSHSLTIVPSVNDPAFLQESAAFQPVYLLLPAVISGIHNIYFTYVLEGTFSIRQPFLSSLAYLNSTDDKSLAQAFNDIQLPTESFPSLQELHLESSILNDIVAAWKVQPFVSSLTKAIIRCSTKEDKTIYDKDVLRLILPLISASSPHIRELTLDGTVRPNDELLSMELASSPWTHIGHLSLSFLRLGNLRVDAPSFKNVQQVWPRLVVLDIPDQTLTFQHLAYLSQLPELKKLIADGFEDMGQVPEIPGCGSSTLQTINICEMVNDWVEVRSIKNVA
ncbi:hypothetical protein FRC12_005208, partial [Ceratobasidium sp. 428]